ncbi:MAG: tyrosine-type recombinase/integrase [Reyranellaceae bacterium]
MRFKLQPPGKRGKFWYLRGTLAGRRFEVSTGALDRAVAESWALDYLARLGRDPLAGGSGPVTWEIAAAAYRAWRKPRGKEVARHDRLDRWFAGRDVASLTHAHLVDAAVALFPTGAPGTRNREVISPAAAVLHYAADQQWCQYRRLRRFKEPRRSTRRPVAAADMGRLIAATEGHQRLFLMLAYETGLRLGSLLALRAADLDLSGGRLLVDVAKNGERVELRLSPSLVALLATTPRCPATARNPWLLPWRSASGVYRWLKPLRTKLKIHYTPHLSRHAMATDLLRAGVPDRLAAAAGAWRDERSLHRYQHVETADLPLRDSGALRPSKTEKPGAKRGKKRASA